MKKQPTRLYKLGGYYLIPHELLHVLAYRLIGKRCVYRWGDYSVRPLEQRTKSERLFVSLFPTVVCLGIGLFFHGLWLVWLLMISRHMPLDSYFFEHGPSWFMVLPLIASLFVIYSGNGWGDWIISYRVLAGKNKASYKDDEPQRKTKQYD
ncbi:DUF3267 domain-containing protein [Anaerolineales bacterium HSG6]|nr:DUF3267 domain-containing protein [Anaerolineales bacterium HSG6]